MRRISIIRRGLTLIEMLIVLALLGILAALALPNQQPATGEQLRGAAEMVASDISYARSLAMMGNSRYRITFDTGKQRYILRHSGSNPALNTLPADGFGSPADPPDQRIGRLDRFPDLATDVRLLSVDSGGATVNHVEFGPLGETTRATETVVWLTAGHGSGRRWVAIRINPATGLVRIGNIQSTSP